jgi:hypothetical protein
MKPLLRFVAAAALPLAAYYAQTAGFVQQVAREVAEVRGGTSGG